jgi:hypothetical protein
MEFVVFVGGRKFAVMNFISEQQLVFTTFVTSGIIDTGVGAFRFVTAEAAS